jgi:hypothetical protein
VLFRDGKLLFMKKREVPKRKTTKIRGYKEENRKNDRKSMGKREKLVLKSNTADVLVCVMEVFDIKNQLQAYMQKPSPLWKRA